MLPYLQAAENQHGCFNTAKVISGHDINTKGEDIMHLSVIIINRRTSEKNNRRCDYCPRQGDIASHEIGRKELKFFVFSSALPKSFNFYFSLN